MNFMQKILFVWFLIAFFSITIFLKIENQASSISYPFIFFPLFNLDIAFAIYVIMKLVKEFREKGEQVSSTMIRYWISLMMIILFFFFKMLISLRMQNIISIPYTIVFMPLFILLIIVNVSSFKMMFKQH